MNRRAATLLLVPALLGLTAFAPGGGGIRRTLADEAAEHEGTWLQWPHQYTYGKTYRNRIESTWIEMTRALVDSENVHVVAYNKVEQSRIEDLLTANGIALDHVDFLIRRTDDCWVRDNGPIFVRDVADGHLAITDWGFNGWGKDAPYRLDDTVPAGVAEALGVPRIALSKTILEGGAIEVDGRGVLMATRSSLLEPDRNPKLTQVELESRLSRNFGATKFLWLDGAPGGKADITDTHIDGFARFATPHILATMSDADLDYWGLSDADIAVLRDATDVHGDAYRRVDLPLTAADVVTTYGFHVGFKGSYVNFYAANTVVLVPTYADANDAVALALIQQIYEHRTVVGIDCRNLYRDGGMVHCVTQQQSAE